MSIDPEVIAPYGQPGLKTPGFAHKWLIYCSLGVGVLIVVGILSSLFPLIMMPLLLGSIWKQAVK